MVTDAAGKAENVLDAAADSQGIVQQVAALINVIHPVEGVEARRRPSRSTALETQGLKHP